MAKAANKLYSRAEIREELLKLKREVRNQRNSHIAAFGAMHHEHGQRGSLNVCGHCHVCVAFDAEIQALTNSIYYFGGRPRG